MSQPLGMYVGNALEVYECIKILRGETEPQMQLTLDLSVELTARLLLMSGLADSLEAAKQKCHEAVSSGNALDKFRQNIELQNGDPRVCDDPENLLSSGLTKVEIRADADGFIKGFDALAVGRAVCDIGGGRIMADDGIDHAVGYECHVGIGAKVSRDQALGTLYCRNGDLASPAVSKITKAYSLSTSTPDELKLVIDTVSWGFKNGNVSLEHLAEWTTRL
jgi:Thymidine phosphorylase